MTRKENISIAMSGGKPDFVPSYFSDAIKCSPTPIQEFPPRKENAGYDGYGVHWTATDSALGAFTPTSGVGHVLTDITKWKEQVSMPFATEEEWEAYAKTDKEYIHYSSDKLFDCMVPNGIFERLHFLMGFEEALISICVDPEAVEELLDEITDYKVHCAKMIGKYYKPDYFTYLDDYSHFTGLMMSPNQFRAMFKPRIRKIIEAVHESGMKFKFHCCGKMESLLEDFIELEVDTIDPCQPCNDVANMIHVADGRVGIMGGLDLQHVIDIDSVSEEKIRAEVRRCIDVYGPKGYTIYGASLYMFDPKEYKHNGRMWIINDECDRYQGLKV